MSQKSCDDFFYKQCKLYFKYLHVEIADFNEFFSYLRYLSSGLKLLQSQNSYSVAAVADNVRPPEVPSVVGMPQPVVVYVM